MDEQLSWRAKLAKSNINILGAKDDMLFVEFTYHPNGSGSFRWCKTYFYVPDGWVSDKVADRLLSEVLSLRKELEN